LPRWALCVLLIGCAAPGDPAGSLVEQPAIACGDGPTVTGMDVSYYETSIDWDAAHAAGIDFAFVRVSDGLQFIDPKFPAYWAGARAAGVIRGAYQFFRPAQDPIAQADLLLDRIGPVEPDDLPPVIDVEVSGGLSTAEVATRRPPARRSRCRRGSPRRARPTPSRPPAPAARGSRTRRPAPWTR